MGGIGEALLAVGASVASGAEAIGGSALGSAAEAVGGAVGKTASALGSVVTEPAQNVASGVFNAGKETLANAWEKAGSLSSGNAGDIAHDTAKAIFSANYAGHGASAPTNANPQNVQTYAPDAGEELNKLMSNTMG